MSDINQVSNGRGRVRWHWKKPAAKTKSATSKALPGWKVAGAPGALTTDMVRLIRRDPRLRVPGSSPWMKAPTPEDARSNSKKAAKSLKHKAFRKVSGASALSIIIGSCRKKSPCGSQGCFWCGQMDQRWLVTALAPVLSKSDKGYSDWAFNFVMPEGQTAIHSLPAAQLGPLIERIRRALLASPRVLFAALGIDISANDDTEKFLRGRLHDGQKRYFQAHVYGVVRAESRDDIWRALRDLFGTAPNIYRPLWVSPKPFDGSAKGVSYILKPQGFRHIAYLNHEGHWKTRKPSPKLKPREQVYYLLAMNKLGLAHRIGFVGLHPVVVRATTSTPATVVLRRVARKASAK